ncbi:MAG: hypothetical protein K0S93_246 [Nitrososphaeraceae archaeon]|jgi:hypothetical protein|nr:hypothetical protein [Nitrososphaeraceae archaeon]MCD6036563.1 hypothetical protein [Nitrososphaeraceae archaeon]MDF2736390.1 hypothetical protein [Nitrososphaeraceae archaeon]MDF2769568.1 hypothetical protein [Nitrososphaeraceae archaeon]
MYEKSLIKCVNTALSFIVTISLSLLMFIHNNKTKQLLRARKQQDVFTEQMEVGYVRTI